jgi:hypothetical protein
VLKPLQSGLDVGQSMDLRSTSLAGSSPICMKARSSEMAETATIEATSLSFIPKIDRPSDERKSEAQRHN